MINKRGKRDCYLKELALAPGKGHEVRVLGDEEPKIYTLAALGLDFVESRHIPPHALGTTLAWDPGTENYAVLNTKTR